MDEPIVAIATSVGVSALNIIKVSGRDCIKIVNSIFKGKNLEQSPANTINYGFIVNGEEKIDEVLVSIFKAPKSYTAEDVVEINCHGGIVSTNKILELILTKGVRLAEPGEFLKRAFLNGRVDLVEAEAVQDLIMAKTDEARKLSMNQIEGKTSKMIEDLRNKILPISANIEVNIDYPEYEDAVQVTIDLIKDEMKSIKEEVLRILKESENTKIIKNGINVGIIGKPNVGKSSILNKMIGEEKAIVTNIKGTTRDVVEGSVVVDGILLNLIDTAGIRETDDIVEKIGVEKSLNILSNSDLVLLILDSSEELSEEDKEIMSKIEKEKTIIVLNKNDLEKKIKEEELKGFNVVETNTMSEEGIKGLIDKIKELFHLTELEAADYTYLSNSRQISILKESLEIIDEINIGIENEMEVDLIAIDIKRLWDKLGEIIGDVYDDSLLDEIFANFCLGK